MTTKEDLLLLAALTVWLMGTLGLLLAAYAV